jgi:hypothetical protein
MVLTVVGMRCFALAIVLCAQLAGIATADGILVTSSDQSESGQSAEDRRANAQTVKGVLDAWVSSESLATDRQIDVGVVRLTVEPTDAEISIVAELRIAISDADGKMVSVVSGTSTVIVSSRMARPTSLPLLRTDALVAATRAMLPKLRTHLHVTPSPNAQTWNLVQLLGEWFARLSPRP